MTPTFSRASLFSVVLLACCWAPRTGAMPILTWGAETSSHFLDLIITVTPEAPSELQESHASGWNIAVSATYGHDIAGSVAITAPPGHDKGYVWLVSYGPFGGPEQADRFDLFLGSKFLQFGLWDGEIPQVSRISNTSLQVTWNVPDAGATGALLLLALAGVYGVRRFCCSELSSDPAGRSG